MSWEPNVYDVDQIKDNYGLLLEKAVKLAVDQFRFETRYWMRDVNRKRYAMAMNKAIITARKQLYGSHLSVHSKVALESFTTNKLLLIWVDSMKCFYKIDPIRILGEAEPNERMGIKMLNFPITWCEKYEQK